jgi:hypothetical protein
MALKRARADEHEEFVRQARIAQDQAEAARIALGQAEAAQEKTTKAVSGKGKFLQKKITETVGLRSLTENDWENPVHLTARISGRSGARAVSATSASGGKSAEKSGGDRSGGTQVDRRKKRARRLEDSSEDDEDGVDDVDQDDELEDDDGNMFYSHAQQTKSASSSKKNVDEKHPGKANAKPKPKGGSVKTASKLPEKRKVVDDDVEDADSDVPSESGEDEENDESDGSLSPMNVESVEAPSAESKAFVARWNLVAKNLKGLKHEYLKVVAKLHARENGDPTEKYMDPIIK